MDVTWHLDPLDMLTLTLSLSLSPSPGILVRSIDLLTLSLTLFLSAVLTGHLDPLELRDEARLELERLRYRGDMGEM